MRFWLRSRLCCAGAGYFAPMSDLKALSGLVFTSYLVGEGCRCTSHHLCLKCRRSLVGKRNVGNA